MPTGTIVFGALLLQAILPDASAAAARSAAALPELLQTKSKVLRPISNTKMVLGGRKKTQKTVAAPDVYQGQPGWFVSSIDDDFLADEEMRTLSESSRWRYLDASSDEFAAANEGSYHKAVTHLAVDDREDEEFDREVAGAALLEAETAFSELLRKEGENVDKSLLRILNRDKKKRTKTRARMTGRTSLPSMIEETDHGRGPVAVKCKELDQTDYTGSWDHSVTGKKCKPWKEEGWDVPGSACRNPNGDRARAWCFTLDSNVEWERCPLVCDSTLKNNKKEGCSYLDQVDYRGTLSVTRSGRKCQKWADQTPHIHPILPEDYPLSDLRENFCRNPDGRGRVWCYTADPFKEWEYCDLNCPDDVECASQGPKHTHPRSDDPTPTKIFIGSCMNYDSAWNDGGPDPKFWQSVVKAKPDLWIWGGDVVYGDTTDTRRCGKLNLLYNELKSDKGYKLFLESQIPVIAMWDDHDYGANNAGAEFPKKRESKERHMDFFNHPTNHPVRSHDGLYQSFMWEGSRSKKEKITGRKEKVKHIVVDVRYFREPWLHDEGDCTTNPTILGKTQWAWLEKELKERADVLLFTSGIQVLPPSPHGEKALDLCATNGPNGEDTYLAAQQACGDPSRHFPSSGEFWGLMPDEKKKLLQMLAQAKAKGVYRQIVILSGDVHWGEISTLKVPKTGSIPATRFFELTSSGISNRRPSDNKDNGNRLSIACDKFGDGLFTKHCQFPFIDGAKMHRDCVSLPKISGSERPICFWATNKDLKLKDNSWGFCAQAGDYTPLGRQGRRGAPELYNQHPGRINLARSNYGAVEIDFDNNEIALQVVAPHQKQPIALEMIIPIDEFPCNPTKCAFGLTCHGSSVCHPKAKWDVCTDAGGKLAGRKFCPLGRYQCNDGECAKTVADCEDKGIKFGPHPCSN